MLRILLDFATNPIFLSTATAWFVAQCLKVILAFALKGFSAERFVGGGGMPSSHSATVTGLATSTGIICGLGGFEFPMALFFAIIVIYDAMGVRYVTGKEAEILNKLMERDIKEGKEPLQKKKLNELMGHTLMEIIVGVLIGIISAFVVCSIVNKLG